MRNSPAFFTKYKHLICNKVKKKKRKKKSKKNSEQCLDKKLTTCTNNASTATAEM